MQIKVNGENMSFEKPLTITGLTELLNYDIRLIAVEHNGAIPSKDEYGSIVLNDGDTVEIVTFMGGG